MKNTTNSNATETTTTRTWKVRDLRVDGPMSDAGEYDADSPDEACRLAARELAGTDTSPDIDDLEAVEVPDAELVEVPALDWACWYDSACGEGCGVHSRYETEDAAQAAVDQANEELAEHNPGGNLLCAFEVRQLVDGEWVVVYPPWP